MVLASSDSRGTLEVLGDLCDADLGGEEAQDRLPCFGEGFLASEGRTGGVSRASPPS